MAGGTRSLDENRGWGGGLVGQAPRERSAIQSPRPPSARQRCDRHFSRGSTGQSGALVDLLSQYSVSVALPRSQVGGAPDAADQIGEEGGQPAIGQAFGRKGLRAAVGTPCVSLRGCGCPERV